MLDVLERKNAVGCLVQNGYKPAQLLQKKWKVFKEIISILQVPYAATVALQKHDLTKPDWFAIWLTIKAHLLSPVLQRSYQTNFASCLIEALDERKKDIFNNPTMLAALYLDPRYRGDILQNNTLVERAQEMLISVWRRLVDFHPELVNESSKNFSAESSGINMNIDFNNTKVLEEYLSGNNAQNEQPIADNRGLGIEGEIELFQPDKISLDCGVISYWQSIKEEQKNLYAIPPAETQIERDFSILEFIFTQIFKASRFKIRND